MIPHSKSKLALAALVCTFLLVGCRSQEEKARALYNEALIAKRNRNRTLYESLLREVGEKYKSTELATAANVELNLVEEENRAVRQTVVSTLLTFCTSQTVYKMGARKYAPNFQSLVQADLLVENLLNPNLKEPEHRYFYEMKVPPDGQSFVINATPPLPDRYHFYIDQSCKIRYAIGRPASRVSPEYRADPIYLNP